MQLNTIFCNKRYFAEPDQVQLQGSSHGSGRGKKKFRKIGLRGCLYKGSVRLASLFLHRSVVFSSPDPLELGESCLLFLLEAARLPLLEASQVAVPQTAAS